MAKNILVVDDELLIRDLLYDYFSERGWEVSVCDSGERAMEVLKTRKFHVALVDLRMPEIDGISLIRKIKSFYPSLAVVLMTAFPSTETAIEALRLKVDDYIIKPFNINKLFKTIDSVVEESMKKIEPVRAEDFRF